MKRTQVVAADMRRRNSLADMPRKSGPLPPRSTRLQPFNRQLTVPVAFGMGIGFSGDARWLQINRGDVNRGHELQPAPFGFDPQYPVASGRHEKIVGMLRADVVTVDQPQRTS